MDLARPFEVVTPTLDGVVLQVLAARRPNDPATVAEIRREAGCGSEFGLRKAANRLVTQGVVEAHRQLYGLGTVFRLNRSHLAFEAVLALARQPDQLRERLAEAADEIPGLHHAEVVADPAVEPALVLVADPKAAARVFWPEDADHLKTLVRQWTGLVVTVQTVTPQEWERRGEGH